VALIVIDASVLIAFLDSNDPHHRRAVEALGASSGDNLVLPASAYAEVLVGPLRREDSAAATVDEILADLGIAIQPITREIARHAAALRAAHSRLRLPDALVLAAGEVLQATSVLTADGVWPRISRRARLV
jgi:predicted nucleic acid-binding protein